jgi:flavodoxin
MKTAVIYSSLTGNTKKIAEAIAAELPGSICVDLKQAPDPAEFDLIAMGFWAKRGSAAPAAQAYMQQISGKKVITFFTLGAYPDSDHAQHCASAGNACYGENCTILGTFWCQGALNPKLREHHEKNPENSRHPVTDARKQRWADAATHPDEEDIAAARAFIRQLMEHNTAATRSELWSGGSDQQE